MTTKDQKGVDESDPDNKQGKGSDGAADQSKVATVPLSVLEATRADLRGQLARAQLENDRLKAGQQKPTETAEKPATIYTRTQLRALVNEGKITEDQMDATLEQQLEAKLNKKVESTAIETAKETRASTEIGAQLNAYTAAHPDIIVEGSDLRNKVIEEFNYLVSLGDPENKTTELKAVRAAIGPLTPKGRRKQPEAHEETGGSGDDARGSGNADTGWAKGLSPAQKKHYQKQIDRNFYNGPTDKRLVAEVKIARERRAAH